MTTYKSGGFVRDASTNALIVTGVTAGGAVATDPIFDAKGDLAVGTGADTAVKLSAGTNGSVLTAQSGQTTGLQWAAPPLADRKRALWLPAVIDETASRFTPFSSQAILASGTLRLCGGIVLAAGVTVTSISVWAGSGAGAGTPTHQWFCLVRLSDLAVLRKTADDTNVAWSASAVKTLNLSSTYTPSAEEAVYVGVLVTAATPPQLNGWSLSASPIAAQGNTMAGNSTTGLTDPASLGGTAGAVTASGAGFYATVQ